MNRSTDPTLLVPRTCTMRDNQSGEHERRPLADYRNVPAYILLGDPGSGKTKSFEMEAAATGGHYVRARSFAAFDPTPELSGKTLFIDGLDEMRAGGGDGRTPLDHVRRHLDRLGRPHFRLSCREADWFGDSDRAALLETAPGGTITVLHLDPLSDVDIHLLLKQKFAITDPNDFVQQADRHGLADLLSNPQTLKLLANTVGSTTWPDSRTATYELACQQLLLESNPEHRAAKRNTAPTHDELLEATGFLCAVQLLAGIAGFALDNDAVDEQHPLWRTLLPPSELSLSAALAGKLFQHDELNQQRIPVHRSIAEFLGAQYLSKRIDKQGLPLGRIVALLSGEDGGIVPDLRGLSAWLAVHCHSARTELAGRDPLGVVLYGDVRSFSVDDKRHVLSALRGEAENYTNFRFQDWTAAPFGALATPDMIPLFLEMLASKSYTETDVAILDCALDALQYGPQLAELATDDDLHRLSSLLDAAARDTNYPIHIRQTALKILLRDLPRNGNSLVSFARSIRTDTIKDEYDQLLDTLLIKLFPEFIQAGEIFDFLRPKKQDPLIGDYNMFWSYYLPNNAPDDLLPVLLDQLVKHIPMLRDFSEHNHIERIAGNMLARTLKSHSGAIEGARLYDWLGTGLDKYETPRIDGEHQRQVATWLEMNPESYKAVLSEGARRCIDDDDPSYCLYKSISRLYGAKPPLNIIPWYLEQAASETHTELKSHFFNQAATHLIRQGGQDWLTLDALDYLEPWIIEHPEFEPNLEPFISLPLNHWRKKEAARENEWSTKHKQRREGWRNHFRENIDAIREGSAHPGILHDLAKIYLIKHTDIEGETPHEWLANFLGEDDELIAAAYSGFRRSLDRDDLPSVAEIIKLETEGHMHFIRQPCLVGMSELYDNDAEAALQLDKNTLRKLIAFRLTWGVDMKSGWFTTLAKTHPDLMAEVFITYILSLVRKGREHVYGVWQLAYDKEFAEVARIALPDLLKGFPLRMKNKLHINVLDPLLKAALRYLDRPILATIISAKLAKTSMTAAQRVYWLACGLIISPKEYEKAIATHIGDSKTLRGHLGAFLHDNHQHQGFNTILPESSLALLIELLAPDSPPERPTKAHWVSPAMHTADTVRSFLDTLGGNPNEAAQTQLKRLLALPQMEPWYNRLRHAAYTQRIARRKASFRHLDIAEICRTLSNHEPANAADLAALSYAHLRDLSRKIRDSSTNDYRQYWSYDTKGMPERPKPENDCRDILLSDLKERIGRLGIDAIKEGYYVENKRADIRVSYGGTQGFNVPIEIKKDSHSDLWRAMHEQLIEHYSRDPGADGFGIYLVFWFGGNNMPLPQEGKKPRNATELEQRLRSLLTIEEARHISVIVIDCSLP